ncbi:hypothetical protein ABT174_38905 [Streptomyces sparsogenes]|uniref:hypothetical protein n=1 Tax=Streptomyces sparsogenes TaxID=67365 RepID=UPI00331D0512
MQRRWACGDCWLWCERTGIPVLWLGPVQWEGQHAPLYACQSCLRRLEEKLAAAQVRRGRSATPGRLRWGRGNCWLWCERTDLLTLRLGTVENDDLEAPLTVCEACIRRLECMVLASLAYVPP